MRPPPPVEHVLASGRAERGLIAAVSVLAACALLAWAMAWAEQAAWPAVLATALPAWAAGLWLGQRLLPVAAAPRRLRWTGTQWQLDGAAGALCVDVQLDLGAWLLLRWRSAAGGRGGWAVLRRRDAPQAWHALRVALQAQAGQRPVQADVA